MRNSRSYFSRRQFLAGLGSAGIGAGLAAWLPAVVERAYAASEAAGCGSLSDIEHFVFIMQENRSFDHYFGTLSGVRGFDDPTVPTHVVGGRSYDVFHQFGWEPGIGPTPAGYTLPFAFQSDLLHDDQCLNDPTHDWAPQHASWNHGRMDSFLTTHLAADSTVGGRSNAPIVMSHYDRSTLPFYYDLADAFTICDNYHCSVLGPTYPNRAYWMSGTLDPNGEAGGPILMTLAGTLPDPASWGYLRWKTMPEVLEEAGVSWKVYQSTDAIGGFTGGLLMDNILRLFQQYQSGPLFDKALLPTVELNLVADVLADELPSVSWIVTDFSGCEHPAAPPAFGGVAVAEVLDILTLNPAVWEKTAVVISYDENGGFFDHVAPPVASEGTPGEWITKQPTNSALGSTGGWNGPIGLGFRVPCLVISPYTKGGLVYSGVLDHTSQLRLIESRFGTPVPNLSPWRRQAVGDLTGAFDFAAVPQPDPPGIPLPAVDPYMLTDVASNALLGTVGEGLPYPYPPNSRPGQEPGSRRRPSGIVCHGSAVASPPPDRRVAAPAAPAAPAAAGRPPTATQAAGPAAAEAATAVRPSSDQALALTGSTAVDNAVRAAALIGLGGVAVGLAHQLPGPRPVEGAEPDQDQD
jgi:phospholipase C